MALIPLYGQPSVYSLLGLAANTFTTSGTLSAATNGFGTICAADNPAIHGGIKGLLVNCTTVTGTPTFRGSLQTASARGTANGTILGGGSPASKSFVPTVNFLEIDFDNVYTPSNGDLLALVLEYISGSTSAVFSRSIPAGMVFPYPASLTAGTWAALTNTLPCMAPIYVDGYIGRGCLPAKTMFNNITAATSYGSLWTAPVYDTLSGAATVIRPGATTGGLLQATLYEGTSTTISALTIVSQSANMNIDIMTGSTGNGVMINIPMPTYLLKPGNTYRLVVTNSGSTAYQVFGSASFTTLAALQSFAGYLTGTIGTSTAFTDYNSGSDYRCFPVVPCKDSDSMIPTSYAVAG